LVQYAIRTARGLGGFIEKVGYAVVKTNDGLLAHVRLFGSLIWLAVVPGTP
jgi:hypothetical protein